MQIKAKLIKRKDIRTLKIREAYSDEGDIIEGYFYDWPQLGKSFLFYEDKNSNYGNFPITTTLIEEIIDYRNFKTKNSIYEIITLVDERNEKINNLLIN